jgi:hypothetical protein
MQSTAGRPRRDLARARRLGIDSTDSFMTQKHTTTAPNRDARGRWIKGKSGNDLGRPRSALAELCRQQITKHALVAVLGSIAARSGDYGAKKKIDVSVGDQVQAIKLLLLYGFGAPKSEIDSGDVKIEVTYADNRSLPIANAAPGAGDDHQRVEALQRAVVWPPIREDHAGNGPADSPGAAG